MDRHQKITTIADHYDTFWHGNLDGFDDELTPAFVDVGSGHPPGPEPVKAWAAVVRQGLSDVEIAFDETVVEDLVVVTRTRWTGVHSGPLFGHPATGNTVGFSGTVIWELTPDGRICRRLGLIDMPELMAQLSGGEVPAPA